MFKLETSFLALELWPNYDQSLSSGLCETFIFPSYTPPYTESKAKVFCFPLKSYLPYSLAE